MRDGSKILIEEDYEKEYRKEGIKLRYTDRTVQHFCEAMYRQCDNENGRNRQVFEVSTKTKIQKVAR